MIKLGKEELINKLKRIIKEVDIKSKAMEMQKTEGETELELIMEIYRRNSINEFKAGYMKVEIERLVAELEVLYTLQ